MVAPWPLWRNQPQEPRHKKWGCHKLQSGKGKVPWLPECYFLQQRRDNIPIIWKALLKIGLHPRLWRKWEAHLMSCLSFNIILRVFLLVRRIFECVATQGKAQWQSNIVHPQVCYKLFHWLVTFIFFLSLISEYMFTFWCSMIISQFTVTIQNCVYMLDPLLSSILSN